MPERSFGRTVRYRRTKLGLSQAKLGELVGRSASTIRSWERDKSHPNETKVLTALSAILGVDERSLFEKAGQEPPEVEDSPTIEQELASLRPDGSMSREVEREPGKEEVSHLEEVPEVESETLPEVEEPVEAEVSPQFSEDDMAEEQDRQLPVSLATQERSDEVDLTDEAVETVETSEVSPEPAYAAPPEPFLLTRATPRFVEPSYIEDTSQRQLYRVRNLATLVILVALGVAFLWAIIQGFDALSTWWDEFFGSLRL